MSVIEISKVTTESEEACLSWGGEFGGEACISVRVEGSSVKICARIRVNRLGEASGCYDLASACHTIIDAAIAKLSICFSDIEMKDGIPRCLRVKLTIDPIFGSDFDIINHRICFFGILGSQVKDDPLSKNRTPDDESIILIPLWEASPYH